MSNLDYIQNIKLKNVSLWCLLFILASSCAHLKVRRLEKEVNKPLNIGLRIASLEILDKRTDVTEKEISLPFMSWPGQNRITKPILDSAHKNVIIRTVRENFKGEGKSVKVKVLVQDAYKQFKASMSAETEIAYVSIHIDVTSSNGKVLFCNSEAGYYVSSSDATYKRIERLYRLSLRNAVYSCLEKMSKNLSEEAIE